MSTNDITGLRAELFETIRALRSPEAPMDIERAKAVAQVSAVIIESAKVEAQMIHALGRGRVTPTGFIGPQPGDTLELQARTVGTATTPQPGLGLPPPGPKSHL